MCSSKKQLIDSYFCKFETFFKFAFLILTLLSFNNLLAGNVILKFFSAVVAVSGAVIVFYRLLNVKKYIKFYGFPLLILFLISYSISSIYTFKYGIIENMQALIWMILHFAILYTIDLNSSYEKEKKEYFQLMKCFLVYIALANIASIGMLIAGYGRNRQFSISGNVMGYLWGRLWGVYSDPNSGSVFCIASILISIYFFQNTAKKWKKIGMVLNAILSLCYITFSDSRTGMVTLVFTVFLYSYAILKNIDLSKVKGWAKQTLAIVCAVIIAVCSLLSINVIKGSYNFTVNLIHHIKVQNDGGVTQEEPNTIDRTGDELDQDISNRRFSLWQSGVEVWKESPIVGVSHRNIVNYALENVPDTYLVNNDRGHFNTTHNSYIDVLLSQGVLGVIIFLAFFVYVVSIVFKKMFLEEQNNKNNSENMLLLGLILTFACSAIFILEIIYINTAGAIIFWMSLGRLVKNLKEKTNDCNNCCNTGI